MEKAETTASALVPIMRGINALLACSEADGRTKITALADAAARIAIEVGMTQKDLAEIVATVHEANLMWDEAVGQAQR